MCVAQVIRWIGQTVGQTEIIKLSRMTNASTAIVSLGHSVLFVMKTVLKYARMLEFQDSLTFSEALFKGIIDIMIPL